MGHMVLPLTGFNVKICIKLYTSYLSMQQWGFHVHHSHGTVAAYTILTIALLNNYTNSPPLATLLQTVLELY